MPSTAPVAGSHLLHYRVIERLGAGGMGEVFLAEDTRLGRQVALKFLTSADAQDPEARARLIREAQAASVLRSPNVAVTYDLVEHGSDLFIAMEYVEGELLSDRVARGPMPVPEALDIAMQVADALDEAHAPGHRPSRHQERERDADQASAGEGARLRPGQVPAARRGATTAGHDHPRRGARHAQLHGPRAAARRRGRPPRRPLRARRGALRDAGRPAAVPGRHHGRFANRILNQEPEALARFNYAVPADVDAVVRKALAKDPDFRYQSARELYVDLHHARERIMRESTERAAGVAARHADAAGRVRAAGGAGRRAGARWPC